MRVVFVGANLFAKAVLRAIHMQRIYRPLRE
jgi:methionyl-tRNA formyltransferase